MGENEAALVARAREGDAEAFDSLIRRYLRPAFAVALAGVGNPSDAEDVVQDAFVRAVQRIHDCREPDRFGAWLLQIVRNHARNHIRYRRVRHTEPLHEELAGDAGEGPLHATELNELRAHLMDAVQELTVLQREVVLLYDIEGWSHREIADRLGISEGSARVHLHNARKALRGRMAIFSREA
jgi:RNA polymerase sigma-70 factor (ECF subfamily)